MSIPDVIPVELGMLGPATASAGFHSTRSDPNSNRSRISPSAPTTRTRAKPYSDESVQTRAREGARAQSDCSPFP